MPFHAVPVLFWDGEMLAQTQAIARFVARKAGLAGSNDVEFAYADMIACHCEDLIAKWVWGRFPPSEEARWCLVCRFWTHLWRCGRHEYPDLHDAS